MHLRILPDHQKLFFTKRYIERLEWLQTCFDAFADHQKLFSKKDIFERLEWLKTCFDAFAHTSKPSETSFQKRYSLASGVAKNVFCCIFAYSQTTRIMSFKNIFFKHLEWLKTCFDVFAHTSRPPETVTL